MSSKTIRLLATAAAAACTLGTQAHAAMAYSLTNFGTILVSFDTATPGVITTKPLTGLDRGLDGLDFRPSNGLLYGYSNFSGRVYTVNPVTGVSTFASALSTPTNTAFLGIDFNPVADRMRIVTESDQNLRVTVATGATTVDTPLAYVAGDVNAGVEPNIIEAAYTKSARGAAPASTTLYYIDYITNTLVTTTDPNGGALTTVGSLGFDTSSDVGFDIYTSGGVDFAYGIFDVAGSHGFYSVNLTTGAATSLGLVGSGRGQLFSLAITPDELTVPEPGSLALLGGAGLAAFAARRRRSAGKTQIA